MTAQRDRRKLELGAFAVIMVAIVVVFVVIATSGGGGGTKAARATTGPGGERKVGRLPWPAPVLTRPETVRLTSANAGSLRLDSNRDYKLVLPANGPLRAPNGLRISGGHNVVLVGGTIDIPGHSGAGELQDQTGTIHLEGVRFTGTQLMEGLDLQEPNATVELENIYFATVHGTYTTNHADLIQTWAGPKRLLIDGLYGTTQYQGFFLLPNQHYTGPAPQLFDFRNIYINDQGGAYALWLQTSPRVPLHVSNVNVTPNAARTWRGWWLWPKPVNGDTTWSQVKSAAAAPPPMAKQIATAGLGYGGS
jgi:hypothetical protein